MNDARGRIVWAILNIATSIALAVLIYVAVPWVKAVNAHMETNDKKHVEIDKWISMRPAFATADAVELSIFRAKEVMRLETNQKLDMLLKEVSDMRLELAKHVAAMSPTP